MEKTILISSSDNEEDVTILSESGNSKNNVVRSNGSQTREAPAQHIRIPTSLSSRIPPNQIATGQSAEASSSNEDVEYIKEMQRRIPTSTANSTNRDPSQAKPKARREPERITGDVEYLEEKQMVPKTICYGMLRCPVVMRAVLPANPRVKVNMSVFQVPEENWFRFGFTLNSDEQTSTPFVKLLVYGLSTHAAQIGRQFLSLRVVFSDPDIQPKQDYVNPQRSLGLQNVEYQKNTVVDHTKKQIEELYQSFTSPQNLEEMEQDKRLISPLFKYQKQALHWMYNHEQFEEDDDVLFWKREGNKWKNQITETTCIQKPNRVRGGILADDMGLGKTIQIISLILKAQQTALPKSNILNDDDDLNEIDPFGFVPKGEAKKNAIDPRVGKIDSNSTLIICPLSLIHNWEDQILTHTIPNSLKVLVYHGPNRTQDPNVIKKFDVVITTYNVIGVGFGKDIVSPLHKIKWYRIVLDEAHIIKSSSTIQAKAAFCFKAQIKWCLTGTPVQNKLDDLYSLVKFIQVEPLDRKADWSGYITKPIQVSKDPSAFRKLQTLMRGITLRRVKTDLIDGKPILSLPDRKERVVMLELTPSERNLYDRIHQQGRKMFENLKSKGTVMSNFAMILKSILLMRQACLHPSLVKYDENMFIEQGDVNVNEKLTPELVSSMFHLLRQNEEDYCVMCNNTVEGSGNFMSPCKHLICSECIDNQFSKKQKLQATTQQLICPMCKIVINEDALQILDENVFETNDDELVNFDNQSVFSNEGTKIGALISDLEFIRGQDYLTQTVTKSVVFSQFTSMLTLCENALRRAKIKYCRIDGQMSRQQRSEALIKFKNNPTTLVFLISIKSGGVGLNLVSGNRVYLMEPYWNPAVEQQAVDRVHRLGQTKEVTTTRFIIKNSIEENMQERQKYKTALAQKALDEDSGQIIGGKRRKRAGVKDKEEILQEKMKSLAILFH